MAGRHGPPSPTSFYVSLATAALRAALVIAAVVLGVFVLSRAFPTAGEAPQVEATQPTPEATASPATSPTEASPAAPEPRDPSRVTLQVLNGTDVTGLAAATAEMLEQEGYTNIITITDADRPYDTTTLFYHPDAEVDAQFLQQNYFTDAVLEQAAPDAEVDVTVILGDDYAAAQEEETASPDATPTEEAT